MCGIAGYTNSSGSLDRYVIQSMTHALAHRGPDGEASHITPEIALGAVRLRVIDLDGGEQPMATDDGPDRYRYNGEIYNFAELRRELESPGHRFRSDCDTEVALTSFREWDTDCFTRFRGMFAMALWSAADKRLVLGARSDGNQTALYSPLRAAISSSVPN